jgi:TatA/E family protein of Tat protein translocase
MGNMLVIGEIIGPDILIILAIVMVLFGSTKIPKLARSLGQASHEFRKGVAEGAVDAPAAPPAPAPAAPLPAPAPAPAPVAPVAVAPAPAAVAPAAPAPAPAPPSTDATSN